MKLLITDALNCTENDLNQLKKLNNEVVFMQNEADPLPCSYEEIEGVVCNGLFLHHPIEKFTSLKFVQLTSAGLDRVPLDYIKKQGIELYSARGVYSIPMAEFAVSGVLSLYKDSRFFAKNQAEHQWIKNRNLKELCGKTVCIVGTGSVGNECAKRFKAFGCRVIGVDVVPIENPLYEEIVLVNQLEKALSVSDVIVLTLPLTEQTHHLINDDTLSFVKDGAVLVNIARGGIVDTKSLISALKTKLFGAVLDVFEDEPLGEDSPLWDMDNVTLTPHNSFVGEGNKERLLEIVINNLRQVSSK